MSPPLLHHADILRLHTLAHSAGLGTKRAGLLAGLPPEFTGSLDRASSDAEQLLTDLGAFNAAVCLLDGTVPLISWLRNAIAMAGLRSEAATFEALRAQLSLTLERQDSPIRVEQVATSYEDLTGTWTTNWYTVKNARLHAATLVVPPGHGDTFTATMTIEYFRRGEPTIVEESLAGTVWDRTVSLKGTARTFIVQGSATDYRLDHFSLMLSNDATLLDGRASLTHGDRIVIFRRQPPSSHTPTYSAPDESRFIAEHSAKHFSLQRWSEQTAGLCTQVFVLFETAISQIRNQEAFTLQKDFSTANAQIRLLAPDNIRTQYSRACSALQTWSALYQRAAPPRYNQDGTTYTMFQWPDPTEEFKRPALEAHEKMQQEMRKLFDLMRIDIAAHG